MSTEIHVRPGRPSMKEQDKKKSVCCMLKPSTIEELREDAKAGKAQTPNQMLAKIVEMYYRKKRKKEQRSLEK